MFQGILAHGRVLLISTHWSSVWLLDEPGIAKLEKRSFTWLCTWGIRNRMRRRFMLTVWKHKQNEWCPSIDWRKLIIVLLSRWIRRTANLSVDIAHVSCRCFFFSLSRALIRPTVRHCLCLSRRGRRRSRRLKRERERRVSVVECLNGCYRSDLREWEREKMQNERRPMHSTMTEGQID